MAKGIVAEDAGRLADLAQDKHRIRLSAHVLAGLGLEIAIQAFHPTSKAAPVVLLPEQHDLRSSDGGFTIHGTTLRLCSANAR